MSVASHASTGKGCRMENNPQPNGHPVSAQFRSMHWYAGRCIGRAASERGSRLQCLTDLERKRHSRVSMRTVHVGVDHPRENSGRNVNLSSKRRGPAAVQALNAECGHHFRRTQTTRSGNFNGWLYKQFGLRRWEDECGEFM
jgi:hypothetical protein